MGYGAAKHLYDEAVIMTGDADLTYAVEMTREAGCPAHLLAFASRFPIAISFKANRRIILDFEHHFADTILPTLRNRPRFLQVEEIAAELTAQQVANPYPTKTGHKKRPDA
jgi:hypothetical protein